VEVTGCAVETVNAGKLDLSTRSGRTTARLLGTVARDESEAKSERLKDKHAELARRGRWKGGPRPSGYQPHGKGGLKRKPDEAKVIREAAKRVLAGESLNAIVNDLNNRGVPTAQGAMWRTQTLRRILTAWTVAGHREHRGEDAGPGQREAIVDETTHRRLRAVILNPDRYRAAPPRVALLAGGLARCGRCGSNLITQRRKSGARVYVCLSYLGGCGRLSVQAAPLEELVAEAVMHSVEGPHFAGAVAALERDPYESEAELVGAQAQMEELAEMWATRQITRVEWEAARRPLQATVRDIERRRIGNARRSALTPYLGAPNALRAAWPDMNLDQQRSVVAAAIDQVKVHPTDHRGRTFDKSRVEVCWTDGRRV
jgi:hypothetical protein